MGGGGPLVTSVRVTYVAAFPAETRPDAEFPATLWPVSRWLERRSAELVLRVLGAHMDPTTDVRCEYSSYGSGAVGSACSSTLLRLSWKTEVE